MAIFDLDRVEQQNGYDCGVAALATVLSCDISTALGLLGRDPVTKIDDPDLAPFYRLGVSVNEISRILYRLGVLHYVYDTRESYKGSWVHKYWETINAWDLTDVMEHLNRGGTAILGVDSKNVVGSHHWFVADKCQIIDPSPGKTYGWGEQLPLIHAILIGEWCGK